MVRRLILVCVIGAVGFAAFPAHAGSYADQLGQCLVNSTTRQDREALVRWMFTAISAHPAVKPLFKASPEQQEEANRVTGEIFTRLLTTSCRTETQRVLAYEGTDGIRVGFEVLGQVAGTELMSSPDVAANLAGMAKHLDTARIEGLVKEGLVQPATRK